MDSLVPPTCPTVTRSSASVPKPGRPSVSTAPPPSSLLPHATPLPKPVQDITHFFCTFVYRGAGDADRQQERARRTGLENGGGGGGVLTLKEFWERKYELKRGTKRSERDRRKQRP